jgi:zinc protease
VPADAIGPAAELLADIAVNASFVPEELESEKKVVFEEMSLTEDDPERYLNRRLTEDAYPGHPYGRPILGTREQVQNLTRDTLAAYYHKHYVPENMVLVVVGAVPPAQVRDLAERTFGQLRGPSDRRPTPPPVPRIDRARGVDVRRSEAQAYLGMAWHAAPTGDSNIYAVDLLTYILGDGPSSRLNQAVREQQRLVSSIESAYLPRQLSGLVSVTARADPPNLEKAEAAVLAVVRRIREQGVTEAERQRALITAESSYAFDIETAEGLARDFGQGETTWTLRDEIEYLNRLRQVTTEQIRAAAARYLRDDDYVRVRFVPGAAR